ncbi:hypothetical protein Anapl_02909 [Anas platyrhynchos]|uniref:Uncharacterized protein n=1 Tax=Anas platyrhynchos TaxID=8839 RepID=R0M359_ANAPL|nr:hypothetical protein Anapl_02909 [Anas platyrhynchos]
MTLKLTQKPSFWAVLDAALPLPPSGQPPPPPYGTSQRDLQADSSPWPPSNRMISLYAAGQTPARQGTAMVAATGMLCLQASGSDSGNPWN